MKIRAFQPADEAAVVALWHQCQLTRSWNDPHRDIERKLAVQAVAVSPRHRGCGHGRALVEHVERLLLERGCPKVGLLVRASNLEAAQFYRRLGYAQDESISLGKRLIADG